MEIWQQFIATSTILKFTNILILFLIAWIFHRLARRIAGLMLGINQVSLSLRRTRKGDEETWTASDNLARQEQRHRARVREQLKRLVKSEAMSKRWTELHDLLPAELKSPTRLRQERLQTLQVLIASAITILAFALAIVISLRNFAPTDTVVTMLGLFTTALAFAGRTFVGDYLAGLSIIFQDRFNIGEKLLVKAQMELIEGVVEQTSLNATWLRAPTGEMVVIPNGELRFICNYSRGLYSAANITLKVAATDLYQTVPLLKNLAAEAVLLLPDLKEPWQVISEAGAMGEKVELTLVARAHFGRAADLRPQIIALVQERFELANIALVD
ncbi:MAG TPA: mechanosensitive ion channel domain-containing protein [Anaerolineae bacterium]